MVVSMVDFIFRAGGASWDLLLDSAVYILFGILVAGLLKVVLNPATVARHLGHGRFMSVIKAAFFGVPLPLCSCGVLPAAVSLKKQGANTGATSAFLISTPESGVDSIAITYALLDPIMTVMRPISAFFSAMMAGFLENIIHRPPERAMVATDLSCPIDNCCDGIDCAPEDHRRHHSLWEKIVAGFKYALLDVWGDIAIWFFAGLIIAGIITAAIPDELLVSWLGGGLSSMMIMLVIGIPLYICATASTPVAAALILKGVSPGAALVFLLVGPATNVTSLSVLVGILGKWSTVRYLFVLSVSAVSFGLLTDLVYGMSGISARAVVGEAAELIPTGGKLAATILLLLLSIKPIWIWGRKQLR
ncbi:MAG: SO_0444 family Cu/Zn efflux transporter, partial [Desulfobulbaceae bacterium]|nr:SO_0444 family Cu/Zn efflux transporter [Candidatus Desulfatifera sulfidica]